MPARFPIPQARGRHNAAFTLIELLAVITILAILGGLAFGGLRSASGRGKADSTRNIVGVLSAAILEQYESYEDAALAQAKTAANVVTLRTRIREELPDSWADVAPSTTVSGTTAAGRAYKAYKQSLTARNASWPTSAYAGAECLYMIISQSGWFPDFLSNIPSKFIGDIDKDGAFEFWDGWGRPISFIRWAPGAMPAVRRNTTAYPDPLDPYGFDTTAFALVPLIFSPGQDESTNDPMSGTSGYGLLSRAENGWPDAALATSGTTPCTYNPDGKGLIGARETNNLDASIDNISNFDSLFDKLFD